MKFISSFSQIAALETAMLQTTNDFTASKWIFIEDNSNGIVSDKLIVKIDILDKKSGIEFFISGARFAFAKLKQAFNTTPILYYFDVEYNIQIKSNVLGYIIGRILC